MAICHTFNFTKNYALYGVHFFLSHLKSWWCKCLTFITSLFNIAFQESFFGVYRTLYVGKANLKNKPAAQALGADSSKGNSTNRQNLLDVQNCRNFNISSSCIFSLNRLTGLIQS